MRIAIALLISIIMRPCFAAFTDFSDYTQEHTFAAGETFESNGLTFRAVNFKSNPNPVLVFGVLLPGPGAEFLLPPGVQEISLLYHDGAASRIAINGVEPALYPGQGTIPFNAGFSFLDGSSLAGVSVSTMLLIEGRFSERGILTLRGPINSLVIAGLELALDDITVRVPEPSAALLLLGGLMFTATARRLKRR